MQISLTGGTGLIGSILVDLLGRNHAGNQISSFSRRPLATAHPSVKQMIGPVEEQLRLNHTSCDAGISCLGTTLKQAGSRAAFRAIDLDLVCTHAEHVLASGGKEFHVVSALWVSDSSPFFYSRTKAQMEARLRSMDFRSLYVYRPSLLLGERPSPRIGEQLGAHMFSIIKPFCIGSWQKYRPTQALDVAMAIHRHCLSPKPGYHEITF